MTKFKRQFLAGPYLVWIIGFIVLPILLIVFYGLTDSSGAFTLANLFSIAEPVHRKALFLSLKLALICTLICLVLSYPLAMILNGLQIKHQSFVVFIFVLPMWIIQQRYLKYNFTVFWDSESITVKYTNCRCFRYGL